MTKTIEQLPDGIYFNMPFVTYLLQDRFSTSRINGVNDSPLSYWVDEIEPTLTEDYDPLTHAEEGTEAMAEGRAWHVMALEGEERFNQLYATDYDPADYPDALKSKDEHIKACEKHGVTFKESWTIAKLQNALTEGDADVQFHAELKSLHQASSADKILLSPTQMKELRIAGAVMRQYKIQDDFLSDGFPEVTILFTMDGEKFKIRVDWLAATKQVEFKTITLRSSKKHFETACADQIHDFGYFAGAYIYTRGVEIAREKLKAAYEPFLEDGYCGGVVYPDDFCVHEFTDSGLLIGPDWPWFLNFTQCDRHEYWHLFQQRGKHNHVLPRRFDKYDEVIQHRKIQAIWRTGEVDVKRGVKIYNEMMEKHGRENRWLPEIHAKPWSDDDFKPWQLEE